MSSISTADPSQLPLPRPTRLTQAFWDAAREHRLVIQRCSECHKLRFYPSAGCDHCACSDFSWDPVSGLGRVYSWIVVRRTVDLAWQSRLPFVSAVIELAEQPGVLLPGLLTGIAPELVRADLPVEIWFEDVSPELAMPRWRPVVAEA